MQKFVQNALYPLANKKKKHYMSITDWLTIVLFGESSWSCTSLGSCTNDADNGDGFNDNHSVEI
jgi:hypothetical protein